MMGNMILLSFLLLSSAMSVPFNVLEDIDMDIMVEYGVRQFNTTTVEGLGAFLEWSSVNDTAYNIDTYNCVNFSSDLIDELVFYGFEANEVSLYGELAHAIVAVKLSDKILFIEPQTDEVFSVYNLPDSYSKDFFKLIIKEGIWNRTCIFTNPESSRFDYFINNLEPETKNLLYFNGDS